MSGWVWPAGLSVQLAVFGAGCGIVFGHVADGDAVEFVQTGVRQLGRLGGIVVQGMRFSLPMARWRPMSLLG